MNDDGTILKGVWGGEWEYLSYSHSKNHWRTLLYKVRSKRTGYVTIMQEDSFVGR